MGECYNGTLRSGQGPQCEWEAEQRVNRKSAKKRQNRGAKRVAGLGVLSLLLAALVLSLNSLAFALSPRPSSDEQLAQGPFAAREETRQVGKIRSKIEYQENTAYSVHYPHLGNEAADGAIAEAVGSFIDTFLSDLADYRAPSPQERAILTVDYESYRAGPVVSVAFHIEMSEPNMAHPSTGVETLVFDSRDGRRLGEGDFFQGDYRPALEQLVGDFFRESDDYRQGAEDADILAEGFAQEDIFSRFALTAQGVRFYFPRYLLLPGAYGVPVVDLSYDQLKPYLAWDRDELTEKESAKSLAGTLSPMGTSALVEQVKTGRYVDPNKPMIALTFDDGPRPDVTDRILDRLGEVGGRATFFVLGNRAGSYPDTLAREYAEGHMVASHTYSHKSLPKCDEGEFSQQVQGADEAIGAILPGQPKALRPPYGAYDDTTREKVPHPLIMWSVDTLDWKSRNADAVIRAVRQNVRDGDIVLMHDIHPTTADACDTLIAELAKDYQLVTVEELYRAKGIPLEAGKVYFSARTVR